MCEDSESLWQEAREAFSRLGEKLWAARTTLALLRATAGKGSDEAGSRVAELASDLAMSLGTVAQSTESLVVRALRSVASLGAEASAALKSGVLDAAAVVLSRWNVDARARRALRFVDVQG